MFIDYLLIQKQKIIHYSNSKVLLTDFVALRQALGIFKLGLLLVHLLELEHLDLLPQPVIPLEEGELPALRGLLVQAP